LKLITEPFLSQNARWPAEGRHILAQFDNETIIVYQSYRPETARFAAANGYFGDGFSLSRMSWIKPNFLWMTHRSGWARKEGQEHVLAVRLRRDNFDAILAQAVPSTYVPELYPSREAWSAAVANSSVRLQWDPDHGPSGAPLARRAIQLGLRGEILRQYARDWIAEIEDITDFVAAQRENASKDRWDSLITPREDVYVPDDPAIGVRLGLETGQG
jgi:hypothetical protein